MFIWFGDVYFAICIILRPNPFLAGYVQHLGIFMFFHLPSICSIVACESVICTVCTSLLENEIQSMWNFELWTSALLCLNFIGVMFLFKRAIFHVRLMKWFISVRCYVSEFESIVRKAFANNVGSDFSLEGPICIILEL